MSNDPPPDIDPFTERLGPFVAVYPGNRLNVIAGFIVGALMVVFGFAGVGFIVWYLVTADKYEIRALNLLITPLVGLLGWATLRWAYGNRKTRVVMCENGFAFEHPKGVRWFRFDRIREVVQDYVKSGLDDNGRPFMNRGTTFVVKADDGSEFGLSANLVQKHLTLARQIFDGTHAAGVPWTFYKG